MSPLVHRRNLDTNTRDRFALRVDGPNSDGPALPRLELQLDFEIASQVQLSLCHHVSGRGGTYMDGAEWHLGQLEGSIGACDADSVRVGAAAELRVVERCRYLAARDRSALLVDDSAANRARVP